MVIEIERKFLVKNDSWRSMAVGTLYKQGYIHTGKERTVRIRIIGNDGYLTIKGPRVSNSRIEFEYPIPVEDAENILFNLCERPWIEKIRYKVKMSGLIWEIDEFDNENKGLIVAEVELSHEKQTIVFPEWIGQEVSSDPRYSNRNLIRYPFSHW